MSSGIFKKFPAMRLARSASSYSDHHYQIGCVISVHGRPVSVGFNICKSHPKYTSRRSPSIHAEVRAIIASNCDISGGIAFVYRESSSGLPRLARPCNTCYNLLKEAGIKKVVYTTNSAPYYKEEKIL